ncbi:lactococcin 972 family bacteriocin [Lolliginicoccus suaedae]|uniref:lactococcin 972 family bacteriocin n=1 Tax=Lolliginicoccus suaedae TaxID=2605429 RepID=UPI001CA7E4C7|nr:lactococcin 972 family bacteriocin [Lolliginicoccus suaedae]
MKLAKAAITAGLIAVASAGTANAAIMYVDGGKWYVGYSTSSVWSNYWHPDVNHGSSVVNTETGFKIWSGCVAPGDTSYASQVQDPEVLQEGYYKFC